MKPKLLIPALATALLGLGGACLPLYSLTIAQDAATTTPADGELELLRASANEFVTAFNAGDAKSIGALFLEKAEVVDEDGNLVQGRENIEARFAELFKGFPKASASVEITSLRQISPAVAIEEGVTSITLAPDEPASVNAYTLVHLKKDGKWLFASVRDFPPEAVETPHDHLTALEWLVGHWVDESPDGRVETSCQWSTDGNYLLLDYVVKAKHGGELKGTQRLGWDPLRRSIRGWVFDESGGVIESEWTPAAGSWLVHGKGHTADGQAVSFTRVFTPTSNDGYQIDTTHRIVGGELHPDSTVRVVRRPPAPAE